MHKLIFTKLLGDMLDHLGSCKKNITDRVTNKQQKYTVLFLTVLEATNLRSGCQHGVVKALS